MKIGIGLYSTDCGIMIIKVPKAENFEIKEPLGKTTL